MSNASTTLATPYNGVNPLAAVKARVFAFGIDRELAGGADAWSNPTRAARAQYLVSDRTRRSVAKELTHLAEQIDVQHDRMSFSATVAPTTAVRELRPELLQLSARLRAEDAVGVRGVAALRNLLTDGSGPFYNESKSSDLKQRLDAIDGWLTERR